jgi:putative MATE family efflux protein
MFLMFSLAVALGTGTTAIVSRAYGANTRTEYRKASRQGFRLSVVSGFLLAVVTWFTAWPIAQAILPAKDVDAMAEMVHFIQMYAVGLPAIFVIQTVAGSLRGVGDTKSPMVISSAQIVLHVLFNFLLIFPARSANGFTIPGANMGLGGAGLALSLSATLAAVVYVPFVGRTLLGPVGGFELPSKDWVTRILRIAIPAGVMSVLRVLSLTAFTLTLKLVPDGSTAIAAMGIAFAIESVMFMPSFGLSVAAGALVGQSLGMKDPGRASKLGWAAAHWAGFVTLCLCGPIFFAAPAITDALLEGKAGIAAQAALLMRYLCVTEIFFAYAMALLGAMQGAGDTVRPMWITVIALWVLRVPLAFILAIPTGLPVIGGLMMPWGLGKGAEGAWMSMSITQLVQGVLSIGAWQLGRWKTMKV